MPPKFKRHLNADELAGSVRSERRNLLEEDSGEEEDFFLVQTQVDEVIDVMQENITRVIDRGERLEELQDKSDGLCDQAAAFSSRARKLRRSMWWTDCRMKVGAALVGIILFLVIVGGYHGR
uniref:Vesicle-associated membrane protein 4 n=1 Tax=Erpetoichthys calabaricus TaxID=27687 RepID=A0A8C4XHM5_ERPCA